MNAGRLPPARRSATRPAIERVGHVPEDSTSPRHVLERVAPQGDGLDLAHHDVGAVDDRLYTVGEDGILPAVKYTCKGVVRREDDLGAAPA